MTQYSCTEINDIRRRLAALKLQHPNADLDTMATRYFGRGIEIGDSGVCRELTGLCGYTTTSDCASLLHWLETKLSD